MFLNRKQLLRVALMAAIALTLTNCADKTPHLELTIQSGSRLNPNKDNVPSPLVLHFYELKENDLFNKSDFWALTDDAKNALDTSLVSQSKQILVPNEEQNYKILFDQNTKYFGIVGSFRNIDGTTAWRYVKAIDKGYNKIELQIDNSSIKEK